MSVYQSYGIHKRERALLRCIIVAYSKFQTFLIAYSFIGLCVLTGFFVVGFAHMCIVGYKIGIITSITLTAAIYQKVNYVLTLMFDRIR